MIAAIDAAREAGDTLGGAFEVVVSGVPVGLGSYVQWDRKLDGRLAQALMSIQAIKGVGIGKGPAVAELPGSRIHDEIVPVAAAPTGHPAVGVSRVTNNAGGLEGGVTNGEEIRVTGYMKPIATLMKPLRGRSISPRSNRHPPRSSGATSAPSQPPPSSGRRWWRSSSPTRGSRSSAAIRWRRCSATTPPRPASSARASLHAPRAERRTPRPSDRPP